MRTLDERIGALELENQELRRLLRQRSVTRAGVATLVIGLSAVGIAGAGRPAEPSDVVRAKRVEITDKNGRTRILLSCPDAPDPNDRDATVTARVALLAPDGTTTPLGFMQHSKRKLSGGEEVDEVGMVVSVAEGGFAGMAAAGDGSVAIVGPSSGNLRQDVTMGYYKSKEPNESQSALHVGDGLANFGVVSQGARGVAVSLSDDQVPFPVRKVKALLSLEPNGSPVFTLQPTAFETPARKDEPPLHLRVRKLAGVIPGSNPRVPPRDGK